MDKTFYCKVCKRLIKLDECNACPNKELNIKQTKVIKPLTDEQKQKVYEKKLKQAQSIYEKKIEKLKNQPFKEFIKDQEKNQRDFEKKLEKLKQKPKKEIVIDKEQLQEKYNEALNKAIEYNIKNYDKKKKNQEKLNKKVK